MGGGSSGSYNKQGTSETTVTGIEPYQQQFAGEFGNIQGMFNQRAATPLTLQFAPGSSAYNQYNQNLSNLQNTLSSRLGQPLNLSYGPIFSNTPDAITQNLLSTGMGNIKAQQSAQQRAAAEALSTAGSGNNTALLAALNRMGGITGAGAANALIPQAMEQQRASDLAKQQALMQQNQMRLAERSQSIQELLPALQAIQEQRAAGSTSDTLALQQRTQGLQDILGRMNLLQALNQMAQTSAGKKTISRESGSEEQSKHLF